MITMIDGWYIPADDKRCFGAVMVEAGSISHVVSKCKQQRTCLQAGGNIGIFPAALSRKFQTVYTFELDPDNFAALRMNLNHIDNIVYRNAALTDFHGSVGVDRIKPNNIGAHQVKADGDIPTVMIDDLGLEDLDLLWLDIEGSEHQALLGATKTIHACSPVIVLELKGLALRYGYSDNQTFDLMDSLGYKVSEKIGRDYIFVRN
jgi:FkbM family methyltransferase